MHGPEGVFEKKFLDEPEKAGANKELGNLV